MELYTEELHLQELGIATNSSILVNSNRGKRTKAAKPQDFFYFKVTDKGAQIPPEACDTFFELVAENILPEWATAIAPLSKLRNSRQHGRVSNPRAWIGESIVLIQPRIADGYVTAQLALIESADDNTLVVEPDSGDQFEIKVDGDRRWALDAEFKVLAC